MKGSNIRRWGAALAVVIIAGAAYWFWHDRGTSGSSAPAAGQGPQGPGGARHGRFGGALAPVQA
ncbi:multidrug transporter subunit MdtA, partial [Klebsiella pneumoniae]|nr:multidrug transporter subunit MdtA [Klebsiella pneumoniae]